jgi:hypothetical protein
MANFKVTRSLLDSTTGAEIDALNELMEMMLANAELSSSPIDDWKIAVDSLARFQANNLFVSVWTKREDFENATWVKSINAVFDAENNSACELKVRYTKNRFDWSQWLILSSGIDCLIEELVYGLDFQIILKEGWDGVNASSPQISSLKYDTVQPTKKYYISNTYENTGMIFEYLLSASMNLPKTTKIRWGLCRGDSIDFEDFEILYNGRKSALPNRQYGVRYTTEINRNDLKTQLLLGSINTYQVLESNGSSAQWDNNDILTIKVGGIIVDPARFSYSTDGTRGLIILSNGLKFPPGISFIVGIKTPEQIYSFNGESTYTYDYRTYYSSNGRWPKDVSSVIVLKNNNIIRGGYWLSADNGSVTFDRELETNDVVSVYIQHSSDYRVGVEVTNYDENNDITLDNFGLLFTELSNTNLVNLYKHSSIPKLRKGSLKVSSKNNSLYERLIVDYVFQGEMGTKEQNTQISWWRTRAAGYDYYDTFELNGGLDLDGVTLLPDYRNRIAQPQEDVWVFGEDNTVIREDGTKKPFRYGDEVFVKVTPSDGINSGSLYDSRTEQITPTMLTSNNMPIAWELKFNPSHVINDILYANFGKSLIAQYKYYSSTDTDDDFIVTWYSKEDIKTPYYIGKSIPDDMTKSGQILSYTVQPISGNIVGYIVSSNSIQIK